MKYINPPSMILIHKKSGRRIFIDNDTTYLDYDEDKFTKQENKIIW